MREAVIGALRCPVCARELSRADGGLRCEAGHAFDMARQGYLNLLTGRAPAGVETPEMVAARTEIFEAGHLVPVSAAIVSALPAWVDLIVDVGAGTGHHLAAALTARPGSAGIAVDVSKAAARRCARLHPALSSVVADVRRRLPLADGCADVVLDVFAPRHGSEFHRILSPTGTLIVVTPTPAHLAELVAPLGLLSVDPAKGERVEESLGRWFELTTRSAHRYALTLSREEAARFVAMGPSAWHVGPERVSAVLADWAEPLKVSVSVEVTTYGRRTQR